MGCKVIWKDGPVENWVEIHTDVPMTDDPVIRTQIFDAVSKVKGVNRLGNNNDLQRYEISVSKGDLFSKSEVGIAVVDAVTKILNGTRTPIEFIKLSFGRLLKGKSIGKASDGWDLLPIASSPVYIGKGRSGYEISSVEKWFTKPGSMSDGYCLAKFCSSEFELFSGISLDDKEFVKVRVRIETNPDEYKLTTGKSKPTIENGWKMAPAGRYMYLGRRADGRYVISRNGNGFNPSSGFASNIHTFKETEFERITGLKIPHNAVSTIQVRIETKTADYKKLKP